MKKLFFEHAYLPKGWAENVLVEIDNNGFILSVKSDERPINCQKIKGFTVAGMPNLHSHCFQMISSGLVEKASCKKVVDDFWSWRKVIYEIISNITPEALEVVATYAYQEMLKRGFTSVAEFHYLHQSKKLSSQSNKQEMSQRIIQASKNAQINLCLLPSFYAHGNFGAQPITDNQQNFTLKLDEYLSLVDDLKENLTKQNNFNIGIAPHSLRAVTHEELKELIDYAKNKSSMPIHIHIAEQLKEVKDCLKHTNLRPVHWLYNHFDIDDKWCLIHATHINSRELDMIINSQACVGICPTTEANLGDGIFPTPDLQSEGGVYGIGTDMNNSTCVASELRMLEYAQRLIRKRRSILATPANKSTGESIYKKSLYGGSQALKLNTGAISKGYRADFVVLDDNSPAFFGKKTKDIFDSWIFNGNYNPVRDVFVNGEIVVKNQRHINQEKNTKKYKKSLETILYSMEI